MHLYRSFAETPGKRGKWPGRPRSRGCAAFSGSFAAGGRSKSRAVTWKRSSLLVITLDQAESDPASPGSGPLPAEAADYVGPLVHPLDQRFSGEPTARRDPGTRPGVEAFLGSQTLIRVYTPL